MPRIVLRKGSASDLSFLREMLYLSIYTPPGDMPPSRDILTYPAIEKYMRDWGRDGDFVLLAVEGVEGVEGVESLPPIGAIWMRQFFANEKGYGFVDEDTPEIGMAILPEYRHQGLGRKLLAELCREARSLGYAAISLSVDPHNLPALRLYESDGFVKVYEDTGGSWTMKKVLTAAE